MSGANQVALPRRGQRVRREVLPAASLFDDDSDFDSVSSETLDSNDHSDSNAVANTIVKPSVHDWRHWNNVQDLSPFQSVDGAQIFRCRYYGNNNLSYYVKQALERGEGSLLQKQDEYHVSLERRNFSKESKMTQMPYRECL